MFGCQFFLERFRFLSQQKIFGGALICYRAGFLVLLRVLVDATQVLKFSNSRENVVYSDFSVKLKKLEKFCISLTFFGKLTFQLKMTRTEDLECG